MGWLAGKYRCHPGIHPPPKYLPFSHSSPQLIRGLSLIQFYSFYIFSTFQISAGTHWRSWRSMQQRGRRRQGWQGSSCWCLSASCRGTRWRSPAGWRRSPPGWSWGRQLSCKCKGQWSGSPRRWSGSQSGWSGYRGLLQWEEKEKRGGVGLAQDPPSANIPRSHGVATLSHKAAAKWGF